jgi:hypothetical protein
MDTTANCEAPSDFYKVEEGGEMVSWRRNGRWQVEFFNAFISGRREEGAAPVSEGERSTRGGSWSPCRGVTRGCSGMVADSQSRTATGLT